MDLKPTNKTSNNNHNWPVCPECIGLTGSIKRNWMENHADFIVSTYETMGLEYTCHYFISKSDTMIRFLKRHDLGDKKLIRQDEITRNRVTMVSDQVYEIIKELDRQDVTVTELVSRGYQLTDVMIAWHKKQAELNDMMVGYLEGLQPNFTEHISSADRREVNPTELITEQNSIKRIKAGPTSVGRLFVSNKRTGKASTSRSSTRYLPLRTRYELTRQGRHRRV